LKCSNESNKRLLSNAKGAFEISTSCVPTPGLPGFHTVTVTGISTEFPIIGIDFAGDGTNDPAISRGFFGPMNQLGPPQLNTVFQDNNALIPVLYPGHSAAEDSQFLVSSSAVTVPSGFIEEGPNILQGLWAWSEPQGHSVQFAQLVIPFGTMITYRGWLHLDTHILVDSEVAGTLHCIPEPESIALVGLLLVPLFGLACRTKRRLLSARTA
jgi:hypothetical protein